jgi:hypothetical protein
VTVAQYWNPRTYSWEEMRPKEGLSEVHLDTGRYVLYKPTQKDYLNDLVEKFGRSVAGITPDHVNITVVFYTYD